MAVLYSDGSVVFCYKDFRWPFRKTEFRINGLIGLRPFLREEYSTKSTYISSWYQDWWSDMDSGDGLGIPIS